MRKNDHRFSKTLQSKDQIIMAKNKLEDYEIQLAVKIGSAIQDCFNEESDNFIDLKEISENEDKFKAFIHVILNQVPTMIYGKFTGEDKNMLEVNHIANQLCFEKMSMLP